MQKYQDYYLSFPEVVIVEASAGTGKTYELAKRYIQLILNTPPRNQISTDNILAITFTNKATKEMKERILELLKRMALNCLSPQEEKTILPFLNTDKEKIREKASKIIDELIKNYSLFQVQTIDSFINTILLSSALKIDRSANFKIKKEYTKYLSYSLDTTIDEAKKDKRLLKIFEEFIEYYLFIENQSSWFPRQNILNTIKFLFSLNNYNGYDFVIHDIPNSEILETKFKLYNTIKKLTDGANKKLSKSILKFIEENDRHFNIKNLPPSLLKGNCIAGKEKKKVSNLIRKLAEMEAYKTFSPYIKLFLIVLKELYKIAQKEDVLFLEELNKKTYMLINKEIGMPELYYRMSMRFYHYLIDEFQDTSLLQWLNLKPMVEDSLSSGGTLFYVGDRKQAIYRFRGGEARLFDDIKQEFKHFNPKIRFLKKNWRSQKEIVEFNNEVFSSQNLERALLNIDLFKEDPQAINKILDIFKDSYQEYEPNNKYDYDQVRNWSSLINQASVHPDYMVTEQPAPQDPSFGSLHDYVDIFTMCVRVLQYGESIVRAGAEDKEEWIYTNTNVYPYPSIAIDRQGVELRLFLWFVYQHGYEGMLYSSANDWTIANPWVNPMTYNPEFGNGCSCLLYPGDLCYTYTGQDNVNGPVSSIRLEMLRDGLEDTQLLYTLAHGVPVNKANELMNSWSDYTDDPDELLRVRGEIADMITGGM